MVGYHFARSTQPQRAIEPLMRAGQAAIGAQALLDATHFLKEAAQLLELEPRTPERVGQIIRTWATLIEVGYTSDPPTTLTYAEKLFQYWADTVDLEAGRKEALEQLDAARTAPPSEHAQLLRQVFREIPITPNMAPVEVFWKKAELQILQSVAMAIMGRTEEFQALLERVEQEHPVDSPYRAGALIARAALSSHTGQFAGVLKAQREQVERLRTFRYSVERPSPRLAWALGMGCYFLNMVRALRGEPLDAEATQDGFEVAETFGFTDIRIYHLFTQIVRASFTGDAVALAPALVEKKELIRRLGNPRLPERNLAIYTPPYFLERGELEQLEAVLARGQTLAKVLPGDRWLRLYVEAYTACRDVLANDVEAASQSLPRALTLSHSGEFRMETLVRVYQSRFERTQGHVDAAREAAEMALVRALDPDMENPFDEILARRALAPLLPSEEGMAQLERALALASESRNVLQVGLVNLGMAELLLPCAPLDASRALDAAERSFNAARAPFWLSRVASLREEVMLKLGLRTTA
jgi:hypothetical protein